MDSDVPMQSDQHEQKVDKLDPTLEPNQTKEDLSKKLRQKMKTQRMQRNTKDAQRAILKDANVPENMMDKAMNILQQKNSNPYSNILQTMMSQLSSMPKQKKMKAPTVDAAIKVTKPTENKSNSDESKMNAPNVDL